MDASTAITSAETRFRRREFAQALDILDAARRAGARDATLESNRCLVLQRLGRMGDAIDAGRSAVALHPSMAAARSNLAGALSAARRFDEALAELDAALRLDPGFADAYAQRGLVLQNLGHMKDAIDAHRQALTLSPDMPEAWSNIGICLQAMADVPGAMAAYRRAMQVRPGFTDACSNLLMCAQYHPSLSAAQLRALATEWQRTWDAGGHPPLPPIERRRGTARPLRVGYVSADFYRHPVGWFLRDVLRSHDPARVDVTCYASQGIRDAVTEEMIESARGWCFVGEMTDEELARRIRDDGIDVLVDLGGHTAHNRLGAFALRAAPVQVSWLGYFASTGLAEMDAVLLSRDQLAQGAGEYFTEPLVPLDCCQFAYAAPEYAPEPSARPGGELVFGCFNNLAKVNDEVLAAWQQILAGVPASRLVLKWNSLNDPWLKEILQRRLASHGIDARRVEFRGPVPHADLLEEYADIDVALDPFPFSGALTTCEALWMGVPVVTLASHRPASRQTASILHTLGLDSLAATTPRDYVQRAVELAGDGARRSEWRRGLRARLSASPIGDGRAVARELERAFGMLHARAEGA
jgi:protein O-GlcNAc transferase